MGKGKHSGDPNDFGDTSSYTYRGYTEDDTKKTYGYRNEDEIKKPYSFSNEEDNDDENNEEKMSDEEFAQKRADEFLNGFKSERENNYMDFDDDEKEFNFKKLFIIVLIIILIAVAGFMGYRYFTSRETEDKTEPAEPVQNKMIEEIEGYKVLGKIVIEDQNIEQYILDSNEDKALENGVTKLYGGSLNNYGNFCIVGHNKEGMFANLANLQVGDEFKIVDKYLEETTYEVTEIYKTEPEGLKCLMQDESKVEITLITCEDGSTSRLIVKAEEKNNNDENENTNTTNTSNTNTNTNTNTNSNENE